LDLNDYVKLEIRNITAARDVTAKLGARTFVEKR